MMLMTMVLEGTTSRHGVSITWTFLLLLLLMLLMLLMSLMLISISLDGSTSPAVNVDGFGSLGGDIVTDYSVLMEMMVMVVVVQKNKLRCEMYTEILSPSFVGMTFNQASVLCFSKVLKNLFV